jgi:hypothetical protein
METLGLDAFPMVVSGAKEDDRIVEAEAYSRFQQAQATAKERGLVVVSPGENELFVDIDDAESLAVFDRLIPKIVEMIPGTTWVTRPSPSGEPNHHVVVTLGRNLDDVFERVLLQAILGSDRMREVLSWQRATRGDPLPTLSRPSSSRNPRTRESRGGSGIRGNHG